jgi:hypothetical protein
MSTGDVSEIVMLRRLHSGQVCLDVWVSGADFSGVESPRRLHWNIQEYLYM